VVEKDGRDVRVDQSIVVVDPESGRFGKIFQKIFFSENIFSLGLAFLRFDPTDGSRLNDGHSGDCFIPIFGDT
jgi:hypothetical protein